MDEDRQRPVAAWSVVVFGPLGIVGTTLVVEDWRTAHTVGAYVGGVVPATVAGALSLPGRPNGWI